MEELDSHSPHPASNPSSDQDFASDSDSDSDGSDRDPTCHPILEPTLNVEDPLLETADILDDSLIPGAADCPEVVQLLWKQLFV